MLQFIFCTGVQNVHNRMSLLYFASILIYLFDTEHFKVSNNHRLLLCQYGSIKRHNKIRQVHTKTKYPLQL